MSELEWRRRWKKNLRCAVWQTIVVDGTSLFVKFVFEEHRYELLLSNLSNTWFERMEAADIESRHKEINPAIEVPLAKLLHHLEQVLQDKSRGVKFTLSTTSTNCSPDGVLLEVSFNFAGLPFVWKFYGKPVDQKMVSEHLLDPLMTMVSHLTYQRNQLFQLLRNKDKEIFDLKSQGIQTTRKNLETKTFDETSFINNMLSSKEFDDQVMNGRQSAFDEQGQQLYQEVMMKLDWMADSVQHTTEGEATTKEPTFEGQSLPSEATEVGLLSWSLNRLPQSILGTGSNSASTSPATSPSKPQDSRDIEIQRRQELEAKRLAKQDEPEQKKKKKILKF